MKNTGDRGGVANRLGNRAERADDAFVDDHLLEAGRNLLAVGFVGGEQERGRRAGFEDVAGAIGFGAAAAALGEPGRIDAESAAARRHTDQLLDSATAVSGVFSYGDTHRRVPHIVCLGVEGVEAEPVLIGLDQADVAVHSGSSCSSESLQPSPVLEAMGADGDRSLRLSVGWSTDEADIEAFDQAFAKVVGRLRDLRS